MIGKEEMAQGVHKWCPECGRLLRQWRGKFLCSTCWVLFEKAETVSRETMEGLCVFSIVKDSEVQRWRICGRCGKTWIQDWDKEYLFQVFNEEMFSKEYVDRQRRYLQAAREKNLEACRVLKDKNDLFRKFIDYEKSKTLVGLAPAD